MAWNNTPSDWQTTTKPEQYKDGATGLTAKQTDMAGSMYPGAFKPSEPEAKPQDDGISSDTLQQEKAEEYKQAPDKMAQKKAEMQASGIQQKVQDVSSRIGAFSYSLQEKVNKFLTAPTDTFGIMATLDPKTGEIVSTDTKTNLDPAIAQKQAQQKAITDSMQQYVEQMNTGGYRVKSFMEAMKGQLGNDDQSAQLMQMIDTLDNMKKSGYGDSTEAKALQQQMEEMDTFGLASQLRGAKSRYENLMGIGAKEDATKWYGETGKTGMTALELSRLSHDQLKDEMQKASVSASGLFSGEVESSLVQEYDRQSVEAKRSGQLDKQTNEAFGNALDTMLKDTADTLGGSRKTIEAALNDPGLQQEIKDLLAESGIAGADLWGDMLSDSGTFYDVIINAMNDPASGLASGQRKLLSKYLGEAGGAGGQMAAWIKEVKDSGSFTITGDDEKATPIKVTPTAAMKHEILRLLTDPNIDKATAAKQVGTMLRGIAVNTQANQSGTVDTYLKAIMSDASSPEGLKDSTLAFKTNLQKTLKTFVTSKTAETFKQAMIKEAATMIPGIATMDLAAMSAEFHKLDPAAQDVILKKVRNGIAGVMVEGDTAIKNKIDSATNGATEIIAKKVTQEIPAEKVRLQQLQNAAKNYIPNLFSKYRGNVAKQYDLATSPDSLAAITRDITGRRWYKDSLAQGLFTDTAGPAMAQAIALDRIVPAIQQAIPGWKPTNDIAKAFNTGSGTVDLNMIQAYTTELRDVLKDLQGNPQRESQFTSWAKANLSTVIDANTKFAFDAGEAIKKLDETSVNLRNTLALIGNIGKSQKGVTQFDPEDIIADLLKVTAEPGTTEAGLGADTGMQLVTGNDGKKYLSFGNNYIPVTDELLAQITGGKETVVPTGIPNSISTGPSALAAGRIYSTGTMQAPAPVPVPVATADGGELPPPSRGAPEVIEGPGGNDIALSEAELARRRGAPTSGGGGLGAVVNTVASVPAAIYEGGKKWADALGDWF